MTNPPFQPDPFTLLPQWLQNASQASQDPPGATKSPTPGKTFHPVLGPLQALDTKLRALPGAVVRDVKELGRQALHEPRTFVAGMVGPGNLPGRPTAAIRIFTKGPKGKPQTFTGAAHPFARLDAEAKLGDLLDENFEPRWKIEEGFVAPDGKTWWDRQQAYDYAKQNKLIGGNPKAVENVKRVKQLKSEALKPAANGYETALPVAEILQRAKGGGFTFDPRTGSFVEKGGFVVANPPGNNKAVVKAITPETIEQVMRDNADLLSQPGMMLGGWWDKKAKKFFLEVSQVVPDEPTARRMMAERGEKAIWDLDNMREIRGEPDKIAGAVIRLPGGEEIVAPSHMDALLEAERRGLNMEKVYWHLGNNPDDYAFKTVGGKYLNRKEAAGVARQANQLATPGDFEGPYANTDLVAEDLKPTPPVARSLEAPPVVPVPTPPERGFGLGGFVPEQKQLSYFTGPRTKPEDLQMAYELSRRAFRPEGPYKKWIERGRKFPGAEPWYTSTREIYRDAADEIGEEAAAKKVNALLGLYMPASTARSAPPNNLKRAFIWQALHNAGLVTPEMLRSSKIVMPEGFGHFAQTTAHQPAMARLLETGALDPAINPKPASFGPNLTGNQKPGTFDTVMGRIARAIDPRLNRFFGKGSEGDGAAPLMWAYEPLERGLADAADEAAGRGILNLEEGIAPTGAYQSLGWHGETNSAAYGSMGDIWRTLRKNAAEQWGVSESEANRMIWKEGRVPLLDTPLEVIANPRAPKKSRRGGGA